MSTRRPRLRIFQKQTNTNDLLIAANTALSESRPNDAMKLYTQVLYNHSPGHCCALLNRSLCYLYSGHYELAAADAYMAALASHEMRDDSRYFANSRLLAQQSYLRAEGLQVDDRVKWTQIPSKFVGDGWAESVLASIVINDQPDLSNISLSPKEKAKVSLRKFQVTKRDDICTALEARAIYRLAGALYLCGGGARGDAIGLIDDALAGCALLQWETLHLKDLGDEILMDVVKEIDDGTRAVVTTGSGHDPGYRFHGCSKEQRMEIIKENMSGRSIYIFHDGYPKWNSSEPDLHKDKWLKIFQNWLDTCSSKCELRVLDVPDAVDEKKKAYVELVAKEDIWAGEDILSHRSIFNVTTNDPRKPLMDPADENYFYQFCDVCASLLIVPQTYELHFKKTASSGTTVRHQASRTPEHDSPASRSSNKPQSSARKTPPGKRLPSLSSTPTSIADTEIRTPLTPASKPMHEPRDLQFCSDNHLSPICSHICSMMHTNYDHSSICGTGLERSILRENLCEDVTLPYRSDEEHHKQALLDLLFLRVTAYALQKDQYPLHIPQIAFATAGINFGLGGSSDSLHPWSFNANIVKPLHILHRLCTSLRIDQFSLLKRFDGWILNTLIVKIANATRFSPSAEAVQSVPCSHSTSPASPSFSTTPDSTTAAPKAHYTKFYHPSGKLDAAYLPSEPRSKVEHDLIPSACEQRTRVARMAPMLDIIRVADHSKGEKANVRIEQREGVQVFAVGKDGDKVVAIKKGEVLLRNAVADICEDRACPSRSPSKSVASSSSEDSSSGGGALLGKYR